METTELNYINSCIANQWHAINITLKEGSPAYIQALELLVYYYKKRQRLVREQQ